MQRLRRLKSSYSSRMKIYLEFVEGTSSKFWSVEVEGGSHTVRYGRIGTAGQSKESSFGSEEDAVKDAEKQADKKRKKGYADAEPSEASPAKPDKTAKKKAPLKTKTKTKTTTADSGDKPAAKAPKAKPTKAKAPKKAKPPSDRTIKSFFKAIRDGNVEKVAAELERAIDPSLLFDIQEDSDPWSPLFYAVYHRQVAVANLLLDRGADASFRCKDGVGPLHRVRDAVLCQRLVDGGADPSAAGNYRYSPLHGVDNVEVARVLLDAGSDVNAEDKEGRTPYELTANVAIRDLLMERGSRGLKVTEGAVFPMTSSEVAFEEVDANRGTIGVAHDGAIWFGGYSGLFRVKDGKTVRYQSAGPNAGNPAIGTIASAHGVVYISTNWGLLAFDGTGFRMYTHTNSPLHDQHITQMAVVDDEVYCVGYERETKSKHISVFDGKSWRLLRPGKDLPEKCDTRCAMRDAAGRLLLSSNDGGGLYALEDGTWTYDNFGKDHFTPTVYVMASHDGVDYFGTHSGLWRRKIGGELEQVLNGAFSQLAWAGDTLWAATNWDGLYAIVGADSQHYDSARAGVELSNVEAMCAAPDGTAFVLTGRFLIQVKEREFTLVEKPVTEQEALASAPQPRLPLPEGHFVTPDKLPSAWVAAVNAATLEGLEAGALLRLAQPAIGVEVAKGKAIAGASKLGGVPDLPKSVKWPKYEDNDDHLPFILQINFAELSAFDVEGLFPSEGMLYLFSDTGPENDEDEGYKVLFGNGKTSPHALPADLKQRVGVEDFVASIDEQPLRFYTQFTLPSGEWIGAHAELSDADESAIEELRESLQNSSEWSSTQMLGWPSPVQGEFMPGREAVLLLQLDTLGDFGNWIVDGYRYFLMTREGLAAREWDQVGSLYQYT